MKHIKALAVTSALTCGMFVIMTMFCKMSKGVVNTSYMSMAKYFKSSPKEKKPNIEIADRKRLCKDQILNKNVYSRDATSWHKSDVCQSCHNYTKVNMETPFGQTPIYIYESKNDLYVSGDLKSTGKFDASKVNGMVSLLNQDADLKLIDIGANIGVHTLTAAKMGRKVIAVEALDLNLWHLCASITAGGFEQTVTLVHNAITDGHTTVSLGVHKDNMGGTFVDVDAAYIKELKLGLAVGTYGNVDTITMDDLLELPMVKEFKKVIIKMDIEGFEHKAVAKSEKLFKNLDVRGFIIEWEFHRKQKTGELIVSRMKELNFEPYNIENLSQRLNLRARDFWPNDVLWRPGK